MAQRDKKNKPDKRRRRYLVLLLLLPCLFALWSAIAGTMTYSDLTNLPSVCCNVHNASGAGARAAGLALLSNYADFILSCSDNCSVTLAASIVNAYATDGVFSSVYGPVVGRANLTDYLQSSGAQFPACYNVTTMRAVLWDFRTSTLTVEFECTSTIDDEYVVQDRAALFRFDCHGLVTYQRTYWNAAQDGSLYPEAVTAPCNYCDCATEPQVGVTAHDASQARLLARRAARSRPRSTAAKPTAKRTELDATHAFKAFVPRQEVAGRHGVRHAAQAGKAIGSRVQTR